MTSNEKNVKSSTAIFSPFLFLIWFSIFLQLTERVEEEVVSFLREFFSVFVLDTALPAGLYSLAARSRLEIVFCASLYNTSTCNINRRNSMKNSET